MCMDIHAGKIRNEFLIPESLDVENQEPLVMLRLVAKPASAQK